MALLVLFAALAAACNPPDASVESLPTAIETSANSDGEGARPRLVLLHIPCTLNLRYLSVYNEAVTYTPAIEEFAREAAVFERHQTEAGQSGIAYSSIFSGAHADRHGVYAHPAPMDESIHPITTAFRDAGYDVWFWTGQIMATASLAGRSAKVRELPYIAAAELHTDEEFIAVLDRLRRDPNYKAFVVTAFTQTHGPYALTPLEAFRRTFPAECAALEGMSQDEIVTIYDLYTENYHQIIYNFPETRVRLGLDATGAADLGSLLETLYKANVHALDRDFAELIAKLKQAGLYEDAVIAFTADHGESTYQEHGLFQWTHGHALSPEVLQVPWILRAPSKGVVAGRYPSVTRSIDVYPTLTGIASVRQPARTPIDGVNLAPSLRNEQPFPELVAYSHTSLIPRPEWFAEQSRSWTLFHRFHPRSDPNLMWAMIRQGDLVVKHVNTGNETFQFVAYDHARDAFETTDIFDENDPVHAQLADNVLQYKERLIERATSAFGLGQSSVSEDEQEEALRSLGYIQ